MSLPLWPPNKGPITLKRCPIETCFFFLQENVGPFNGYVRIAKGLFLTQVS